MPRFSILVVSCCSMMLTGCSWLGLYRYKRPEVAPPEEAAQVKFPDSFEKGTHLTGPMLAALKVAMDDYRPPWIEPEGQQHPDERCLADWNYIDASVQQVGGVFFVRFSPDLRQCGPGFVVLDAGAEYAVDGKGRILAREQ